MFLFISGIGEARVSPGSILKTLLFFAISGNCSKDTLVATRLDLCALSLSRFGRFSAAS